MQSLPEEKEEVLVLACVCIDLGIHAGISAGGPSRDHMIALFRADHSGPGHVPEEPPRDWYGKQAEFERYLRKLRRERVPA